MPTERPEAVTITRAAEAIAERCPWLSWEGCCEMAEADAASPVVVSRSTVLIPAHCRSRFSTPYGYAVSQAGAVIGYVSNVGGQWLGRMADGTWPWQDETADHTRASMVRSIVATHDDGNGYGN